VSSSLKKKSKTSPRLTREQRLFEAIRRAYGGHLSGSAPGADGPPDFEFAFHMTDWIEDFDQLKRMYDAPEAYTRQQWREALFGFLIHVSGHMLRAAELTDTLSDPFDVMERCRKTANVRLPSSRKRKSA